MKNLSVERPNVILKLKLVKKFEKSQKLVKKDDAKKFKIKDLLL